jgi:hypothetical protein
MPLTFMWQAVRTSLRLIAGHHNLRYLDHTNSGTANGLAASTELLTQMGRQPEDLVIPRKSLPYNPLRLNLFSV